jgi:excinuclease UvrABC nuclease subunit
VEKTLPAPWLFLKHSRLRRRYYRVFSYKRRINHDDVAMIDEVLRSRVKDLSLGPLPDLFLIMEERAACSGEACS